MNLAVHIFIVDLQNPLLYKKKQLENLIYAIYELVYISSIILDLFCSNSNYFKLIIKILFFIEKIHQKFQ